MISAMPFAAEHRMSSALPNACLRGIEELRQNVDSLLIINNENILEIYGRLSLKQAFGKADDILCSAAKGIAEISESAFDTEMFSRIFFAPEIRL